MFPKSTSHDVCNRSLYDSFDKKCYSELQVMDLHELPRFLDSSYHCSDSVSSCCSACRNVTVEAAKVCRAARSSCDLPEICPGGTSECPKDELLGMTA